MSFFNVKTVARSRKPSRCHWCDERIQKGDPKITVSSMYEGDFVFARLHPECWAASQRWHKENPNEDEWPDEGAMQRGSTEER